MTNDEKIVTLIQEVIHDVETRIIPNSDRITKKEIIGLVLQELSNITDELSDTLTTAQGFVAIHVVQAVLNGMLHSDSVTIDKPGDFYKLTMTMMVQALKELADVLEGGTADCSTCPDKKECDAMNGEVHPWDNQTCH